MKNYKFNHRDVIKETLSKYQKEFHHSNSEMIEINCELVSADLKVDVRIYRHLILNHYNKKYGQKLNDGNTINIFELREEKVFVNYPLLAATYADLSVESNKFMIPVVISVVALGVSILGALGG